MPVEYYIVPFDEFYTDNAMAFTLLAPPQHGGHHTTIDMREQQEIVHTHAILPLSPPVHIVCVPCRLLQVVQFMCIWAASHAEAF